MDRRTFMKAMAMSAVAAQGFTFSKMAQAAGLPEDLRLVNLMLGGGPDLRHLIVPLVDSNEASYGFQYWQNRYRSHGVGNQLTNWQTRYNDAYTTVTVGEQSFGVLNKAGWLIDQINAGNAAIVNNAIASKSRSHSQAQLALETGDANISDRNVNASGWGNRLAAQNGNRVASLTGRVERFCLDLNSSENNSRIIDAADSRNIPLYTSPNVGTGGDARASMSRALRSYYEAKRAELSNTDTHYKFVQNEQAIREISDAVDNVLDNNLLDDTIIEALYSNNAANQVRLNSTGFGRQIRNLYDCLLCAETLDFRVASMNYGGWDSHGNQAAAIEPKLEDIFGRDGGFAALHKQVALDETRDTNLQMKSKLDNQVLTIAGEFGRQLKANGDSGTDHGRGMNVLIIGERVNGGLYGDLFPSNEIDRFKIRGADIHGLTSVDQVFAPICEKFKAGAGASVFPNYAASSIEEGVDFSNIIGDLV